MSQRDVGLTLPSFAKINWTLEILGRRPDGYHELRTILQTVDLADTLRFTPLPQGIEVVCDHPEVPVDERNLVHRAARLLMARSGVERGVRIEITKRIPTAAGLGGGSSNAAVTLLALCHLWDLRLPIRELFMLGSQLGADVPFFLIGGTCLGVGRGDEVYSLASIATPYLLLVNGGILVPTRDVYANLPDELTNPGGVVKMPLSLEVAYEAVEQTPDFARAVQIDQVAQIAQIAQIEAPHWWNVPNRHRSVPEPEGNGTPNWARWLKNDLEISVLPRYPQLAGVRQSLGELGARGVLMSGSGSTVFAVFDNDRLREEAATALRATGWWTASVATIQGADYRSRFPSPF